MPATTQTRNDKLKAAHDKLQAAVEEIVTGDDWQRMLAVASKFHNYSFNNQLYPGSSHSLSLASPRLEERANRRPRRQNV